jgi:hypothetical protein
VLWLLAPKAGKEELAKELLGALDCAGGKLLVAPPPPNAPVLAPNRPFVLLVLLLPPTAGADAPKVKPDCCGVPKLALWDGVCGCALARRLSWSRRTARLPRRVWYLFAGMPRAAMAGRVEGAGSRALYLQRLLLLGDALWRS